MLKNFRAFQNSVRLYHRIVALKLPRHLTDQVQRAMASVSLNLAEGAGKTSLAEKRKFFTSSLASLREVQAVLYLAKVRDESLAADADQLAGMIYKLVVWRP